MIASEKTSDFQFRGKRDYLHSTTVFDSILSQYNESLDIDFQFNTITDKQCQFKETSSENEKIIATFRSATNSVCVIETNVPIQGRYPCNEDAICEQAKFTADRIEFQFPMSIQASFLETIVATYKTLLGRTELGKRGKLLFGRLKLKYVPSDGKCVVEHRRMIGDKFFEANLIHNTTKIGSLYFGQQ